MGYNEKIVDEVIAKVTELSNQTFIKSVEDHYAGYFDELGITVNLTSEASDDEWQELALEIINFLNNKLPKNNPNFSWVLSIWRNFKKVGLFYVGDSISDNSAI